MGVIQVQNHLPAFTFAGESSKDYNVYITDVNVFDSAARDVQSVEIPGRNGAYILDHGRYKNVTVTYDCAIGAQGSTGAEDFAEAVAAVRSWLGSHVGYYRLENDLNPDEYRMAAFTGEIEVDTVGVQMGRFSVKFDCKPQRFLVDGDTAQTITSGGTIENPTAFNARPLLMVDGYGTINIGEDVINIEQRVIGDVLIANAQKTTTTRPTCRAKRTFNVDALAANDGIANTGNVNESTEQVEGKPDIFTIRANQVITTALTDITYVSGSFEQGENYSIARETNGISFTLKRFPGDLVKGVSTTRTFTYTFNVKPVGNTVKTVIITITMVYDGANDFSLTTQVSGTLFSVYGAGIAENTIRTGEYVGYSTVSTLGNPMYIDFDIGEAYKYESGEVVSVNSAVSFGAELPELPPGETAITFDNTVTQLQVVPRWWRL